MKDPIVGYDAEGKPFAVFCGECLGSCALVTPSRSLDIIAWVASPGARAREVEP